VFGHDLERERDAAKACIGVVPQEINLNMFERNDHTLINQAGYYGVPKRWRSSAPRSTSKPTPVGEAHRIARTLVGRHEAAAHDCARARARAALLILDEPTAGVDIEIRRSMWEFMREINAKGTTIILTTHYLEEAESLCRNVAIIDEGESSRTTRWPTSSASCSSRCSC
jgi:ABC-2 type transport system ATP-binding protein